MKSPDTNRQQEVIHGQRAAVNIQYLMDICLQLFTQLLMIIKNNSSIRKVRHAGRHTWMCGINALETCQHTHVHTLDIIVILIVNVILT